MWQYYTGSLCVSISFTKCVLVNRVTDGNRPRHITDRDGNPACRIFNAKIPGLSIPNPGILSDFWATLGQFQSQNPGTGGSSIPGFWDWKTDLKWLENAINVIIIHNYSCLHNIIYNSTADKCSLFHCRSSKKRPVGYNTVDRAMVPAFGVKSHKMPGLQKRQSQIPGLGKPVRDCNP